MVIRICAACDSDKTYEYRGHSRWRFHDGYWMCKNCYDRYVGSPAYNPDINKKWNPINSLKWYPINNPKHMKFRDKIILLDEDPRIGVCNLCRAVRGIDCKQTQMHHFQYHIEDPLKDTLEICVRCHRDQHKG